MFKFQTRFLKRLESIFFVLVKINNFDMEYIIPIDANWIMHFWMIRFQLLQTLLLLVYVNVEDKHCLKIKAFQKISQFIR